jgi:hypothetical protein
MMKLFGIFLIGTAMCSNGLFAAAAESGNFVIWDVEERRTILIQIKNIFQLLLHTAETMVYSKI